MSTPGEDSPSADGATPSRSAVSAPKNKQCPFCHESFTSSSLGRHLDLYIKDKNPKAPDGIHDVDKIREIRGVITRRQPRRNIRIDEASSTPTVEETPIETSQNKEASPYSPVKGPKTQWRINKPSWHATGVMTDIPPTPTSRVEHPARRGLTRNDVAIRKRLAEDRTRLRATELALQELLDSVNAARTTAHSKAPFEFDFLSQTFPALCLKLLPQQPTLYAVQVVDNPKYCPIAPPSTAHFERIRQLLKQKLEEMGNGKAKAHGRSSSTQSGLSRSSPPQQSADSYDPATYVAHLTQAWDAWKGMSEARKVSQWHLEVVRAFSDSQGEQKRLSLALAQAEAEQEHLRLQIERLNECQQPKEFTYQIPTNWHIPKKAAASIMSSQTTDALDREMLINKWTTAVRANSRFQQALPAMGLADLLTMPNGIEMDYQNDEGNQYNDDEDGDSIDAAGEDDEDPVELRDDFAGPEGISTQKTRVVTNFTSRATLDPNLRENAMDIDPGDYSTGMLLGARQSTQIR